MREYADGVLARLRDLVSDDTGGGLTDDELAAAVVTLHDHHGLSYGDIALCLPRSRREVRELYEAHPHAEVNGGVPEIAD